MQGEAPDYHRMCCGHKDARIAELEGEVLALKKQRLNDAQGEYEKTKALVDLATKDSEALLEEAYTDLERLYRLWGIPDWAAATRVEFDEILAKYRPKEGE